MRPGERGAEEGLAYHFPVRVTRTETFDFLLQFGDLFPHLLIIEVCRSGGEGGKV